MRNHWLFLLAAGAGTLACSGVHASEKLATQGGCAACHAPAKKLVGPAFREVALKYKGQADAVPVLFDRVRKGSKGVWGPVPMPPTPAAKLSDADLKAVLAWMLKTPA